jgi:transposase
MTTASGTNETVRRTGLSKPTVIAWKRRYAAEGVGGLADRPRPGKPRTVDDVAVVLATLEPPPERLGVTHWSSRLLAAELGLSNVKVAKVWREWKLQPWRTESFKFSTDPQLEAKVRDVVGLYLNPPTRPSCCAWMRNPKPRPWNAPRRCCRPGPGVPEKRSHDYIRHGTTTLFAALEVATGKVTDACYPRYRHEEFGKFLSQVAQAYPRVPLHLVCDNYGTHTHPDVRAWLAKHPRITSHFTPDVGILAEHGGDLLFDHHPPGHPPWQLHLGQGPHRRHRELHRRLEQPLPPLHLDQDRLRVTPTLQAR